MKDPTLFVDAAWRKGSEPPLGTPCVANSSTRAGIAAFHTVLRLAANRRGRRLTAGLFTPPAEQIDLPD